MNIENNELENGEEVTETQSSNNIEPELQPDLESVPETEFTPADLPGEEPIEDKQSNPRMDKLRQFGRGALIWLAVIAVAFLAGFLTFNYARYQPLSQTLDQTRQELSQANDSNQEMKSQTTELQSQLSDATDKISGLESDKRSLQTALEKTETHVLLLQVMVDVNDARLALATDDVSAAKTALQDTSNQLDELTPMVVDLDANLAKSIPQRLELVLSELNNDTETAATDLKLLASSLQYLDTLLSK